MTAMTNFEKDYDPEVFVKVKAVGAHADDDGNFGEKALSPWEVTLEESEDPKATVAWYKWITVVTISLGALCVTSASSMVGATRHIFPGRI